MHKKTALYFVHYGESEKIEKSFAFNVDIFKNKINYKKHLQNIETYDILSIAVT